MSTAEWFRRLPARGARLGRGVALLACVALLATVLSVFYPFAAMALVDHADEVCAPSANPCTIATTVSVVPGTTLDFGTRELRIVSGGRIDIGSGSVEILCGRFNAQTLGEIAFNARGPAGAASQDGGVLVLRTRSTCSGDASIACLDDNGCVVGFCNDGECGGDPSIDCVTHSDCDFGPCGSTGSVSLLGRIEAQGVLAGSITIDAAGDVLLGEDIDVDSTDADSDGGEVEVISHLGTVTLTGRIEATAGRFATGGSIGILAGKNAVIGGLIDASGGDFDGGEIDLIAQRDLTLSGTVRVDAKSGEGAGGFLSLDAGNKLRLTATAAVSANGHQSLDNFGGDGGTFFLTSAGDIAVEAGAVVGADGARPDAAAGTIDIAAEGTLTITGDLSFVARGTQGIGGSVTASACDITFGAGGSIVNVGDSGENTLSSSGQITIASGALLQADSRSGINLLRHRNLAQTPSVLGTVTPPPVVRHVPSIAPCGGVTTTTTTLSTTTTTSPPGCGNGTVDGSEQCDDGDTFFVRGDYCDAACARVECGDPDDSGAVNATDALVVLRVAVSLESCDLCVCNVDSAGASPSASDSLRILNAAVGLPVELSCPVCPP